MQLTILGIRGIPAQHGGFETFAEKLALYLVEKGWDVTVYCQESQGDARWEDTWRDVRLIHIPVKRSGALGTMVFDWISTLQVLNERGLILTLGYNTAIFGLLYRLRDISNIFNMDGLEWKRKKWSFFAKSWLYMNEWVGCRVGNHLIADHPRIEAHLASRVSASKITMIPYGADSIVGSDSLYLEDYNLRPGEYALVIARPEPENSILEIVLAFSQRTRGFQLAIVGGYDSTNIYQKSILDIASDEVRFLGPIYDKVRVKALRFFSRLYIHGHQVGGTNPSLVEALGAGTPILAHDNPFNRWVAGDGAHYFSSIETCRCELSDLLSDGSELDLMSESSRRRHKEAFTWETVLGEYEMLLQKWL